MSNLAISSITNAFATTAAFSTIQGVSAAMHQASGSQGKQTPVLNEIGHAAKYFRGNVIDPVIAFFSSSATTSSTQQPSPTHFSPLSNASLTECQEFAQAALQGDIFPEIKPDLDKLRQPSNNSDVSRESISAGFDNLGKMISTENPNTTDTRAQLQSKVITADSDISKEVDRSAEKVKTDIALAIENLISYHSTLADGLESVFGQNYNEFLAIYNDPNNINWNGTAWIPLSNSANMITALSKYFQAVNWIKSDWFDNDDRLFLLAHAALLNTSVDFNSTLPIKNTAYHLLIEQFGQQDIPVILFPLKDYTENIKNHTLFVLDNTITEGEVFRNLGLKLLSGSFIKICQLLSSEEDFNSGPMPYVIGGVGGFILGIGGTFLLLWCCSGNRSSGSILPQQRSSCWPRNRRPASISL